MDHRVWSRRVVALLAVFSLALPSAGFADARDDVRAMMADINAHLEAEGAEYRAEIAEYITAEDEQGQTIFFSNVGNKQLGNHFVPGDARRAPWSGSSQDITYAVDTFAGQASNLPLAVSESAIDRAMGTWQSQTCSNIPLSKIPLPPGIDLGTILGGFLAADINHSGWVGISPPILGIAFTFAFCSPCSPLVFTDIDSNGKLDTAFKEIYYSALFAWADDGVSSIDIETVALHEAGHGLSQAHFGKLFRTDANGKFHFAPKSVMNAGYTGPQRSLAGTDNAGHCSIWGSWPNN